MTCDNNQPDPFLPVLPDPYSSLTDGVTEFEGATGGATQTFGAIGKLAGAVNNYDTLVNDIYNRAPWAQYAVDVSGMVGGALGATGAVFAVGLLIPGVGLVGLAVAAVAATAGSMAGSDLGKSVGQMLFDPTLEPGFYEESLRNRERRDRDRGIDPETDPGVQHLRDGLAKARARAGICPDVGSGFTAAQKSPYRGDPLTLDLNGDGLNTVPLKTPPLLFDINATGIKNSVGWVAPDDGLLVMDRNGNGMVDSGAELFGNATPAYGNTGNTADGFAALTQEDNSARNMEAVLI